MMNRLKNKKHNKNIVCLNSGLNKRINSSLEQLRQEAIQLKQLKQKAQKTICHFYREQSYQNPMIRPFSKAINSSGSYRTSSEKKSKSLKISSPYIDILSMQKKQKSAYASISQTGNIRQLMKFRNKIQEKQMKKLKNPFYKIQKSRTFSEVINPINFQEKLVKSIKKTEKNQKQVNNDVKQQNFLIPRQKKHWYFAAKNYRLRTMPSGTCRVLQQNTQIQNQIQHFTNNNQKILNFTMKHLRQSSLDNSSVTFKKISVKKIDLEFSQMEQKDLDQQKILNEDNDNENNQTVHIRQKSDTVQYYEIKDYYQKKYQIKQ